MIRATYQRVAMKFEFLIPRTGTFENNPDWEEDAIRIETPLNLDGRSTDDNAMDHIIQPSATALLDVESSDLELAPTTTDSSNNQASQGQVCPTGRTDVRTVDSGMISDDELATHVAQSPRRIVKAQNTAYQQRRPIALLHDHTGKVGKRAPPRKRVKTKKKVSLYQENMDPDFRELSPEDARNSKEIEAIMKRSRQLLAMH